MKLGTPFLFVYRLLVAIGILYTPIYLIYRSFKDKRYIMHILERFAIGSYKNKDCLWVHAASVGEALVAMTFIKDYPNSHKYSWMITVVTPTGRSIVKERAGHNIDCSYVPYDLGFLISLFIKRVQPKQLFIIETELWPNMIIMAHKKKIKIHLINGRLSSKSARRYGMIKPLFLLCINKFNTICVQNYSSKKRFIFLGGQEDNIHITGNIKCDCVLHSAVSDSQEDLSIAKDKLVVFFASTHEEEEQGIQEAIISIGSKVRYIWAPRHKERFIAVAKKITATGMKFSQRSVGIDSTDDIILLDSIGEMTGMLRHADIVVIGGSFFAKGGQSIIEPALWGKPMISGHSLFNFAHIAQDLIASEALICVPFSNLIATIQRLLNNVAMREGMGKSAKNTMLSHQGSLSRTYNAINLLP